MLDSSSTWLQLSLWSVPPLIAILAVVGVLLQIRNKQHIPGVQAILILLYAVVFWSTCLFVASIVTPLTAKLILTGLAYVGIVLTPVAWFAFAIAFTKRQLKLSPRVLITIGIVPIITILLTLTNSWHQLIWDNAYLLCSRQTATPVWSRNPACGCPSKRSILMG
jgi:hypothetical protein